MAHLLLAGAVLGGGGRQDVGAAGRAQHRHGREVLLSQVKSCQRTFAKFHNARRRLLLGHPLSLKFKWLVMVMIFADKFPNLTSVCVLNTCLA